MQIIKFGKYIKIVFSGMVIFSLLNSCSGETFETAFNDYQAASQKPRISSLTSTNNTTLSLSFDVNLDENSAKNAGYSIIDQNGTPLPISSIQATEKSVTLTTDSQQNQNYTVKVSGIKSKNTITMDPAQISFYGDGIPYIVNVSASSDNGSYGTGKEIFIEIKFSETVEVINGTPSLLLETETFGASALYDTGSGSDTLIFKYTVSSTDNTIALDYSNSQALEPGGGTIRDLSSNEANLTLPSPGEEGSLSYNKALSIDTTSSITLANPNNGDIFVSNTVGFYGTAFDPGGISTIEIIITYSGNSYTYLATGTDTWSYDASGLPWNTPMTVQARMTDSLNNIMYSNIISIECRQQLTFGNTISISAGTTQTVSYSNFTNPVIIASIMPGPPVGGRYVDGSPPNDEDTDSALARINLNNGTADTFDIRVMNSNSAARSVDDDVLYFMVEENSVATPHYTLSNGSKLVAKNEVILSTNYIDSINGNTWQTISFPSPASFTDTPAIFVQQISDSASSPGQDYVQFRIQNVTTSGFEIAFQTDASDGSHSVDETISYVAIEIKGYNGTNDPQENTGLFNGKQFQIGVLGGFEDWGNGTNSVSLLDTYTNPLIFLNMNTYVGGNPSYARLHGPFPLTNTNSFDAYVEDTLDRLHQGAEDFVYFVIEE